MIKSIERARHKARQKPKEDKFFEDHVGKRLERNRTKLLENLFLLEAEDNEATSPFRENELAI